MSYIENVLYRKQRNSEIVAFLQEEGFDKSTGPSGRKGMVYVAHGSYTVWFTVLEDKIQLYVEYDCGGEVARMDFSFEEDDFDSFKEEYAAAVDWARSYI